MAEHRQRIQYHPEDHHCDHRRTGYDNGRKPDEQGQQDFDGAEPDSRRDIEIQIAKMPANPLKRIGMSSLIANWPAVMVAPYSHLFYYYYNHKII